MSPRCFDSRLLIVLLKSLRVGRYLICFSSNTVCNRVATSSNCCLNLHALDMDACLARVPDVAWIILPVPSAHLRPDATLSVQGTRLYLTGGSETCNAREAWWTDERFERLLFSCCPHFICSSVGTGFDRWLDLSEEPHLWQWRQHVDSRLHGSFDGEPDERCTSFMRCVHTSRGPLFVGGMNGHGVCVAEAQVEDTVIALSNGLAMCAVTLVTGLDE